MAVAVPWILVVNAFNRGLTIITQLAVGFFLVPEQVGVFAVAAGLAGMVSPFQSGDHARLALQDQSDPAAVAAVLRNWLLLGGVVSCLSAIAIVPLLGLEVAIAPLACLVLLSLLRVMNNVRSTLLSSRGRTAAIAGVAAADGIGRSAVLVGAAVLGAGMWSLVLAEVIAVMTSAVLLNRLEPGPGRGGLRMPSSIARKLAATIGVCLLVGIELNCSAVAIGHWCSGASAGSYAFANRIASQLAVLVLPLIAIETIPRLLAARDPVTAFVSESRRECWRLLRIVLPLLALLVLAGPPAMVAIWGERWAEAAAMLRWLGVSLGFRLGYAMAKAHLEALGAFSSIFALSALDTALILGAVVGAAVFGDALTVVRALTVESAMILAAAAAVISRALRCRSATPPG